MNNKSARVRQQAADLVGRIATVLKVCKEESLLKDLGKTLFEFLGEEYPDVLGSIIGALKGIRIFIHFIFFILMYVTILQLVEQS